MVTSGRLLADVQGAVHDAACGALDSHAGDDDVVQGLGGVIQIGVHGHDTGGMADADGLLAGLESDQLMDQSARYECGHADGRSAGQRAGLVTLEHANDCLLYTSDAADE